MSDMSVARTIIETGTVKARANRATDARISLFSTDSDTLADAIRADLAGMRFLLEHRSPSELLLTLPGRRFVSDEAAFRAADGLVKAYSLDAAEPEIFFTAMPVDQTDRQIEGPEAGFPGCWAEEESGLHERWALDAMRVPQAWAFAEQRGRPSRGEGIVVAQPDTGITRHRELHGVTLVAPRNLLGGRPNDPTDPLPRHGNPGHGTSTASVLASPETLVMSGTAPAARLMPIRTIESVVRLSQIKVAQAIDHAVNNGAHVITMSLGGVASLSLWQALSRAVDAGVIVLAAAGNCVRLVVWPARYEKCIAVAGVDSGDRRWVGSSRGPEVDFAAPGQNVYRATAPDLGVAQGQGTSYAVAMAAGVAACWLAFHGRSNVVSAARARGETVQGMFRRLARATARVPAGGWDAFNMGAGVIDAAALLAAGFDRGLGTESPTVPPVPELPGTSVKSFALHQDGPAALTAAVDWNRHGTEISLALLRGQTLVGDGAPPFGPKPPAADSVVLESAPAPAIGRRRGNPAFEKLKRHKAILAGRAAVESGGFLESASTAERISNEPLSRDAAEATLDRVTALAARMPMREVGDRRAFISALNLLAEHGGAALRKLVGEDLSSSAEATPDDAAALEAVIIADGSRPSFLVENDLPPATHPFMGSWDKEIAHARSALAPVCAAVGRIQPQFGHAGNFIGTGSLVDADKGIILTNYHVMDDARSLLGIMMEEESGTVRVHDWLEIDFVGEASRADTNRFRIVEARLPKNAGRGFGWLDAVTMRIEPIGDAVMPAALSFDAVMQTFTQAQSTTFCTVGFPGPPNPEQGPKGEVDWNFVIRTLFGNLFGVKRLAPGRLLEPFGAVLHDPSGITFGHEATTFSGASGSPLIGWEGDAMAGFGLHFSGTTETSNYAIGITKVAAELRAAGVPV
jgi:hypothetical protein